MVYVYMCNFYDSLICYNLYQSWLHCLRGYCSQVSSVDCSTAFANISSHDYKSFHVLFTRPLGSCSNSSSFMMSASEKPFTLDETQTQHLPHCTNLQVSFHTGLGAPRIRLHSCGWNISYTFCMNEILYIHHKK